MATRLLYPERVRLSEAERRLLARLVANRERLKDELTAGNIEAARGLLTERIAIVNEAVEGDAKYFGQWKDLLLQSRELLRQLGGTASRSSG